MLKILASSLLRTYWEGDILLFRNFPDPLFAVERRGLEEVFVSTPSWDLDKPNASDLFLTNALEWRFRARHHINPQRYEWIAYLDADCLALRGLEHLFDAECDVLIQREHGRPIIDSVFNGYLTDSELRRFRCDGVNAGQFGIRSECFEKVLTEWEVIFESAPPQHPRFRDQTAFNRWVLDTSLRVRGFERGEIAFPWHVTPHYFDYSQAALVHAVGGTQEQKIEFLYGLYMSRFYGSISGGLLDVLEV